MRHLVSANTAIKSHPSTNFSQFILQWEWIFGLHPDHWDRFFVSGPTLKHFCVSKL